MLASFSRSLSLVFDIYFTAIQRSQPRRDRQTHFVEGKNEKKKVLAVPRPFFPLYSSTVLTQKLYPERLHAPVGLYCIIKGLCEAALALWRVGPRFRRAARDGAWLQGTWTHRVTSSVYGNSNTFLKGGGGRSGVYKCCFIMCVGVGCHIPVVTHALAPPSERYLNCRLSLAEVLVSRVRKLQGPACVSRLTVFCMGTRSGGMYSLALACHWSESISRAIPTFKRQHLPSGRQSIRAASEKMKLLHVCRASKGRGVLLPHCAVPRAHVWYSEGNAVDAVAAGITVMHCGCFLLGVVTIMGAQLRRCCNDTGLWELILPVIVTGVWHRCPVLCRLLVTVWTAYLLNVYSLAL